MIIAATKATQFVVRVSILLPNQYHLLFTVENLHFIFVYCRFNRTLIHRVLLPILPSPSTTYTAYIEIMYAGYPFGI